MSNRVVRCTWRERSLEFVIPMPHGIADCAQSATFVIVFVSVVS